MNNFRQDLEAAKAFAPTLQAAYLKGGLEEGKVKIKGYKHSVGEDFQLHLQREYGFFFELFKGNPYRWLCVGMPHIQQELFENVGKKLDDNAEFSIGEWECKWCGEYLVWYTDGASIYPKCFFRSNLPNQLGEFDFSECSYGRRGGPPSTYSASIFVPSGKLVMGNSLHTIFDDAKIFDDDGAGQYDHKFSISNYKGQKAYIEEYAKHGLLTGYLGGGNVDIYADTQTVIVSRQYSPKQPYVASICLSLRWYGAADYDTCMKWNAEETEKAVKPNWTKDYEHHFHNHEFFTVDVEPGIYEMKHNIRKVEAGRNGIQSVIKKVGDC